MNSCNNNFVRIIIRQHSSYKIFSVGILFYTSVLELVEFFSSLLIKVLSVHNKHTLLNIRIVFKKCGCFERGQSLTTTCSVPYITITSIFLDAINYSIHCIYLVWAHNEQLLFTRHQNHILANHFAELTFCQKDLREIVKIRDFLIFLISPLVYW